jgi:predicted Zn-dependent peptidase
MPLPDLILDPVNTPGVMAAKLWIRRGSGADPDGERGAHQLLGSSLTRGCGPLDHLALADLVEGCGAGLRCDTHEDGMLISLKCRDTDAAELLPVLGWMLSAPQLRPEQVNLERELSLQALQRQREDPFHLAYDGWRQLAYGTGPYGHDPLGVSDELQVLDAQSLRPLAEQLTCHGSVLALSGTIPKELLSGLEDRPAFQSLQTGQGLNQAAPELDERCANETFTPQPQGAISLHPLATEQVVMMLGRPTRPHGHPDDLALRLLQAHLGVGMSSLLFRRLREDHGVAYDVGVHHPARAAAAPFVLHASSSVERARLSLRLLHQSCQELAERLLNEEDLELARAKFRGQLAHATQTTGQRAERRAQLRALGLDDAHDQRSLEQLKELDAEVLRTTAARCLQTPLLSLCGPKESLHTLAEDWRKLI